MAEPDIIEPPSFSLGIDDIIEPPSFSLGIEFDFQPSNNQNKPQSSNPNCNDDSNFWVPDSDPDSVDDPPPSRLRRLRRGGPRISTPVQVSPVVKTPNFVEDDIEDFSEEEIVRKDPFSVSQHQNWCSSSKLPLSGSGVLIRPQASTIQNNKSCPPPTSVASNKGKSVISDFRSSPLRRFQLLDSDSDFDDPSEGPVVKGNASGVEFSKTITQKELKHGSGKISCPERTDRPASTSQKQDLWKDFRVDNNVSVPTPVFDELLEEYCNGGKQNKAVSGSHEFGSSGMTSGMNNAREFMETETKETDGFPCHRYFSHNDNRIQRLVRNRLPNFCPLGYNGLSIDYRSQFGNEDNVNQRAGGNSNTGKTSKRATKKNKKAHTEEGSHAEGSWIDPKHASSTPKDAGRRRVRADGQCPGKWITGDNGKKVYVTKTGKELYGQLAYRQYKKESGGFTKSRKKRASKKK
ncbi:uncharacterized protein LOC141646844 [Silene latifolia]|uniref:uncharacterized protein LOC141646844 n=1 Tax=Silene latifolia TaxID=37657 RepID=UPI003D771611